MFAFTYALDCPLCGETYNSGMHVLLAHANDDAIEDVLRKNQTCPMCGEFLVGKRGQRNGFLLGKGSPQP
jgi:ssDNA-binding Zn-finger/Zn-ribbon topoisomerase 1